MVVPVFPAAKQLSGRPVGKVARRPFSPGWRTRTRWSPSKALSFSAGKEQPLKTGTQRWSAQPAQQLAPLSFANYLSVLNHRWIMFCLLPVVQLQRVRGALKLPSSIGTLHPWPGTDWWVIWIPGDPRGMKGSRLSAECPRHLPPQPERTEVWMGQPGI